MAEIGNFFVTIGSKLDSKGFKNATAQIRKLGIAATALGVGMAAMGLKVAKAAGIQEQAEFLLANALKNTKNAAGITIDQLKKYASHLQTITTVGDETTLAVMQLGLSMGISADEIEFATKQTIGLSKAYKVDLKAGMKLVALARAGEFSMMARYIPQLRGMTDKTKMAAIANEAMAKGFKLAEAETKTYLGRVKQLTDIWGDLQETIGFQVIPILENLMITIKPMLLDTIQWIQDNRELVASFIKFAAKVTAVSLALGPLMIAFPLLIGLIISVTAKVKLLWLAFSAHPLVAITIALAAATLALHKFLDAKVEQKLRNTELGKSVKSLIAIQEKEIDTLKEAVREGKIKGKEAEDAANRIILLRKSLAVLEKKLTKESSANVKKSEDNKVDSVAGGIEETRELMKAWQEEKQFMDEEYVEFQREQKNVRWEEFITGIEETKDATLSLDEWFKEIETKHTDWLKDNKTEFNDWKKEKEEEALEDEEDIISKRKKMADSLAITLVDGLETVANVEKLTWRTGAEAFKNSLKKRLSYFILQKTQEVIAAQIVAMAKAIANATLTFGGAAAHIGIIASTFAGALGALRGMQSLDVAGTVEGPPGKPVLIQALGGEKFLGRKSIGEGFGNIINITVPPITSRRVAREYGDVIGDEIMRKIKRSRQL